MTFPELQPNKPLDDSLLKAAEVVKSGVYTEVYISPGMAQVVMIRFANGKIMTVRDDGQGLEFESHYATVLAKFIKDTEHISGPRTS
jgi:hypothetical protein